MDADFWLQRWQEGQIGFHRSDVMPLLEKHWPSLQLPAGSRVLVPLCGKSLDMHWLAAQGHAVLSVDASGVGLRKAQQWAAERGVALQTELADLTSWQPAPGARWNS